MAGQVFQCDLKNCIFPESDAVSLEGVDNRDGLFKLFGRALPDKIWTNGRYEAFSWVSTTARGPDSIGNVFSDSMFNEPVDGAEVKLLWHYGGETVEGQSDDESNRGGEFAKRVAEYSNNSPRIGGYGIRVRVPTLILETRGKR